MNEDELTQRQILAVAAALIRLAKIWPAAQEQWRQDKANKIELWKQFLGAVEEVEAEQDDR